ncbi:MAG: LUD domain-containing protein [Mangrovimonas sp.]|nr:LUD domain-containing protein [Mangrovimonas sp.]MCB0437823.1 LUD domain-containing protein [Mangrovimonas sp.]HPF96943.1 LUD domain-containing protein [Mangrovimonas sp.]
MSLFKKLFGSKSQKSESEIKSEERSKYMPEVKLPIDERFTINFKSNGGKFLYCENLDEIFTSFQNIIDENEWHDSKTLLFDANLESLFESLKLQGTKRESEASYFLTTCENLIADDGSILISSRQIAEKKLKELPSHFVVYATTSQMVESISEGMRGIKKKHPKKLPTNITTIKHFKSEASSDKDFLSYGSSSKNLYLLLLEDL